MRRGGAGARAGGRGPGGQAAGGRAGCQVSEPLWELGIGVAGFRFDDYRGSDHTNTYLFPVPFFAYRGPILRADRDGARAILFSGRRVAVDVSLGASVPTKSKDDEARRGMPDLAGTFEIGPNFIVELWQASNRKLKVELRLPVREAITLERSPRAIGLTFSPNLNLDISGLPGKGNLGLLAGPLFARPALPPVLLRRRPGVRDRGAGPPTRPRAATPAGAPPQPSRAATATPGSARSSATTICTARYLPRARSCARKPQSLRASASHGSSRLRASAY